MISVGIVCFQGAASPSSARRIFQALRLPTGPGPHARWHRDDLLTVHGDLDAAALNDVRALPGVRQVVGRSQGQLLSGVDRPLRCGPVRVGGETVGAGAPTVIAGPCSVEGRAQLLGAADRVAEAGARVLRGGCFKARSSPYSFGGLGEEGLELLAEARSRTGLPVVTEPLEAMQLDVVARYADAFQVGSRNMHNAPLLFAAGAHPSGLPILLKRGLAATVDELLLAAEYVLLGRLAAGREEAGLILCERGIRSFETSTRFTLDVAAIPVLKRRCALPVVVDPSHAAGARALVAPLAQAAVGAGAEGLLVEVHPDPDQAWCDGPQSLTPQQFKALMAALDLTDAEVCA